MCGLADQFVFNMKYILLFAFSVGLFAQQTVNPRAITINSDAETAFYMYAVTQGLPEFSIVANTALDDLSTALTISDGAGIKAGDALKIDNEVLIITSKTGRNLTVTRGAFNTSAASHTAGTSVSVLRYSSLADFCRQKAIEALKSLVVKYLPDVDAQMAAIEASRKTRSEEAVK